MLALKPTFTARDQVALIESILHDPPKPLRKVDARTLRDLEAIVHKALAKESGERYATADAPAFSDEDPADPSAPPRLQQDPNDAEAYHHRGHAPWKQNRPNEAIADFIQALRLRPDDAHLHRDPPARWRWPSAP